VKRSRKQPESQVLEMARLNPAGTCAYHQDDRLKHQLPDKAVRNSRYAARLAEVFTANRQFLGDQGCAQKEERSEQDGDNAHDTHVCPSIGFGKAKS